MIGDRDREADELFELRVSHLPPYYVWGGGTGTIVDDDVANLGLTISDVTLAEPRAGVANATFTVTLSPPGNGVIHDRIVPHRRRHGGGPRRLRGHVRDADFPPL